MTTAPSSRPTVAIVMPAYNAADCLPRTIPAAIEASRGHPVVVVDPASTDDTAAIAKSRGATVVSLGKRAGPAEARNAGVATLDADVALFIDADCEAHADVVDRVARAFAENERLASLTGSYDDEPSDPGFASLYMNLRHHHTHQHARRDDATFWAGCGAVRVRAFRAVDGFDAERFPRPMIEDIELGLRLKAHGETRLDPALQVKHLKRWTLRSVIVTDIVHRAIPWTRLIMERRDLPNDLNLRTSQRVAALVAPLALLAAPAVIATAALAPRYLVLVAIAAAGCMIVSLVLSWSLVSFFVKKRGVWFGLRGWLFHQLHLVYSAATFVWTKLTARRATADPAREA